MVHLEAHSWKRLVALVAALALLLAGAHLHDHEDGGIPGASRSALLRSLDSHPERPAHVESFRVGRSRECVGCRLHDPARVLVRLAVCGAPLPTASAERSRPSPIGDVTDAYRVAIPRAPPLA